MDVFCYVSPCLWRSFVVMPASVALLRRQFNARARGLITAAIQCPRPWPHYGGVSVPASVAS